MPENSNWKVSQPSKITDQGKKNNKKKGKKASTSTPAPKTKVNTLALSLPLETSLVPRLSPQDLDQTPGQLPKPKTTGKKNRDQFTGSGQRSKRNSKDSQNMVTPTHKTSGRKDSARLTKPNIQTRESLRWEGVLQDPQEEAKRLEKYRANRRQRYIAQREALLKGTRETDIS